MSTTLQHTQLTTSPLISPLSSSTTYHTSTVNYTFSSYSTQAIDLTTTLYHISRLYTFIMPSLPIFNIQYLIFIRMCYNYLSICTCFMSFGYISYTALPITKYSYQYFRKWAKTTSLPSSLALLTKTLTKWFGRAGRESKTKPKAICNLSCFKILPDMYAKWFSLSVHTN